MTSFSSVQMAQLMCLQSGNDADAVAARLAEVTGHVFPYNTSECVRVGVWYFRHGWIHEDHDDEFVLNIAVPVLVFLAIFCLACSVEASHRPRVNYLV